MEKRPMPHQHLFLEGKSWPFGLESGRFEHVRLEPPYRIDSGLLRKALAFDLGERAATEAWGDECPPFRTQPGATCYVASLDHQVGQTINEIARLARSINSGEISSIRFDFN